VLENQPLTEFDFIDDDSGSYAGSAPGALPLVLLNPTG
jgi:hypothetical protein